MLWPKLLEITPASIAYICLGGFVVAFSVVSLIVKETLYVNEVILGTTFGVLMGPYFAGIFDPRSWTPHTDAITLEFMRIVLVTGLFAIGVELPPGYLAERAKSLIKMVVPTMAIGWVIVAGLLHAIFPALSFVSCLAISACLTPTDPIICAVIVAGKFAEKHVHEDLRNILAAESAANDGLAYPFLTLAIYLTIDKQATAAIAHWVVIGVLYQVVLGVVLGVVAGWAFSWLMKKIYKKEFTNQESYVAQYLALAIFVTGLVSTLGCDDLLAAFFAGCAMAWDEGFRKETDKGRETFSHVIDFVLNCACFIYIGAWIPFDQFTIPELGITPSKLMLLGVGVIFLRRIPAILVLYKFIDEIPSWKEALFAGHFGPMGVSAVFVSTFAVHKLGSTVQDPPQTQQDFLYLSLQPIVSFVVLVSIVVHSLSIPFFMMFRHFSRAASIKVATVDWFLGITHYSSRVGGSGASSRTLSPDLENNGGQGGMVMTTVGGSAARTASRNDDTQKMKDPRINVLGLE